MEVFIPDSLRCGAVRCVAVRNRAACCVVSAATHRIRCERTCNGSSDAQPCRITTRPRRTGLQLYGFAGRTHLLVGHVIVAGLEARMCDVDDGHRQRRRDVEERNGQQHQSRRRFRRLVALLRHGLTRQMLVTSAAGSQKTSNDEYVEDDGRQRRHEVVRHLRCPHVHTDGRRDHSRTTLSQRTVVRVDVCVEGGDQRAAGNQCRCHL